MWCGKKNNGSLLAVEYVSKTYGLEYDNKKDDYASVGVSYYVVYNPEYAVTSIIPLRCIAW